MPNTMSKTFCIKPWRSAYVQKTGEIRPCCWAPGVSNIKSTSLAEFWDGGYIQNLRTTLGSDIEPQLCRVCFETERAGGTSDRQKDNERFKVITGKETVALKYYQLPKKFPEEMEIEVSNLCNLKCLMCIPEYSSAIATENRLLGRSTIGEVEIPSTDWLKEWLLSKPTRLTLLGGEPLIIPKVRELFEWANSQNLLDTLEVMVITNATKVTDEWCNLFAKCKHVLFMVSLEGIGAINEYIRHGSKWDVIVRNMERLRAIPGANVFVHASPSNLSIMSIDQLVTWCSDNHYALDINPVIDPEIFSLKNLPKPLLLIAKERVTKVHHVNPDIVNQLLALIDDAILNSTGCLWDTLCTELAQREAVRLNSVLDIIPEMAVYWP